jgi:hypothetical protein
MSTPHSPYFTLRTNALNHSESAFSPFVGFGELNDNNIKGLTTLLSINDILKNESEKDARVQHKTILGIFHKRSGGYMDVDYHKQCEKANKVGGTRTRLELRMNWKSLVHRRFVMSEERDNEEG